MLSANEAVLNSTDKPRKSPKLKKPTEWSKVSKIAGLSCDEKITAMLDADVRDKLSGIYSKACGRSVFEKISRQIANTKSHAELDKAMVRQSLVLSTFAARSGFEERIGSVVCSSFNDQTFLLCSKPNWRKLPLPDWERNYAQVKFAWVVSSVMNENGCKLYTAFSLNLSMEDAARSPHELIDTISNRLERALGCKVMICIERDDQGRSHCHGIFFGTLTNKLKTKLKQAGGKWDGEDSRHQRHTKERYGIEGAIGWGWYLHKDVSCDAVVRIPRELNAMGRAHYKKVTNLLLPYFIADRKAKADTCATEAIVLEKTASQQPDRENVDTAISTSVKASNEPILGNAQEATQNAPETIDASCEWSGGYNEKESLQSTPIAFNCVGNRGDYPQEQEAFRNPPSSASEAMQPSSDCSGDPDSMEVHRGPRRTFGECDSQPEQTDQPAQKNSSSQRKLDAMFKRLGRWADQVSRSRQEPLSNIEMLRNKIKSMNLMM